MVDTPDDPKASLGDDGLLLEYAQCNEFYNSRDFIAGDLFTKLIQSFSAFTAILVALNLIAKLPGMLHIAIVVAIGIFGTVSFVSLLLDIQGACSVKVAARLRAQQIEARLASRGGPTLWSRIEVRDRFWEERLMKAVRLEATEGQQADAQQADAQQADAQAARARTPAGKVPGDPPAAEKETEGVLFVFAGRLAIVLWVVMIVIAIAVDLTGAKPGFG